MDSNTASLLPSLIPVATSSMVKQQSNSNSESSNANGKIQNYRKSESTTTIVKQQTTDFGPNGDKNFKPFDKDHSPMNTGKIQQPTTYSSSSNFKIKIYHSSNDLVNVDKNAVGNQKSSFSLQHAFQNKKTTQSKSIIRSESTSKSLINEQLRDRTCSERDLSIARLSDTFQQNSKLVGDIHMHQRQLAKQLKEKELKITEISKELSGKEQLIESLYFEVNNQNEKIFELQDEIKKRKYDMNEMSRRIIELNQELKTCHCGRKYSNRADAYEWKPLSRSLSGLSINSSNGDDKNNNNRWPKIPRINKALKKMIQKRNDVKSSTSSTSTSQASTTGDCIEELKSILQEKEMLITELRLETKLTNHKLLELENTLRKLELDWKNSSVVFGTCSRPNIPPKGRIRFVSSEKVRFAENETIYMLCDENAFPHHIQKRTCHHGQWKGSPARCGKPITTKIISLQTFDCEQPEQSLLWIGNLNQTDEPPYPLPPNSFHFTRVPEDVLLTVVGHKCYKWVMNFEEPVEAQFLLIDVNIQRNDSIKDNPKVDVKIKNRKCELKTTTYQSIEQDEIFGNYFFCDLTEEFSLSNNESDIQTDKLEMTVRTFSNRTVGLEAVMVGETYKKQSKHSTFSNKLNTDCGKLGIQRAGVLEQVEISHVQLSCNDSFITTSKAKTYKFTCNANGMWQGEYPSCVPKKTCSKDEIIPKDETVQIEQVSNVYYVNETEWMAIDYTWVLYTCSHMEGIMIGKNERTCQHGKWTNKIPHCTTDLHSRSTSTITIIIIILILLITVFSLIVYFSIRAHSKKIHRKLESTKSELVEKALNKQMSSDYFQEIGLDTIYEDCKEIYNVPEYEMADDEVRYEAEPRLPIYEPEYLTMTEGQTAKRGQFAGATSAAQQDVYEYSL